jgi:hypothetical protein
MWFIIRAAFCIGVVFSMTPGAETSGTAVSAMPSALALPAIGEVVDGALSICKSDPKLCFEVAQHLAGIEAGEASRPVAKAAMPDDAGLVSDTLTPADRSAAPWHGAAKEARPLPRQRPAPRPTI